MQRFVLVLGAALLLGTLGAAQRTATLGAPSVGAAALLLSLAVALFVRLEELTQLSRLLGSLFLGTILALGNPRLPLKIAIGFLALSFVVGSIGALSPKATSGHNATENTTPGWTTGERNRIWKLGFVALSSIVAIALEAPLVSAFSFFLLFLWERIRWEQDLFLRVRTSGHLYFAAFLLLLLTGSLFFGQGGAPATLALGSLLLWCAHETMSRLTDLEIERILPTALVAILLSLLVGLIAALRVPAWAGGTLFLVFAFLSFLALSLWGTARGTWLRTLECAELALFSREEGLGVPRRALHALREGLREGSNRSPVLYFRGESWSVDAAGYAESKATEIPKELAGVARDEPFAIVRRCVVQTKEVRDARYRPISEWMNTLDLEWIVALDDGSLEESSRSKLEFLGIPKDGRDDTLSIAEATAIRRFANELRFFLDFASAEEKWRQNHLVVVEDVRALREKAVEVLRHENLETLRELAHKNSLLRQAKVGVYSPAIRDFCEELAARWRESHVFYIDTERGGDPCPLLVGELARQEQPQTYYVLHDAADADWSGTTTPIELAEGGLLIVEHARALPPAALERLEKERRSPTGTTRTCLLQDVSSSLPSALDLPRLVYPPLRERAEDLGALLLDAFARTSRARFGRVSAPAHDLLEVLVSHPFMGNERELQTIVERLLSVTDSERITLASVQATLDELRIG